MQMMSPLFHERKDSMKQGAHAVSHNEKFCDKALLWSMNGT